MEGCLILKIHALLLVEMDSLLDWKNAMMELGSTIQMYTQEQEQVFRLKPMAAQTAKLELDGIAGTPLPILLLIAGRYAVMA